MEKNFLLIFQKPELYFFPHYKDFVYAPYNRKEKTPLYYFYRGMNMLKFPCSSFFWGDWKKHITSLKKIIIFDFGYQNCMERYIKKINPDCEVFLFCWNKIDKYHNSNFKFSFKSNIYSTDKGDCEKYNLKYNHIFYPIDIHEKWNPKLYNNLYFIGADKGRAETLLKIHKLLKECGLESDIKIFSNNNNPVYLNKYHELLTDKPINYAEYIQKVRKNGILLDIVQKGQRAITMRVLESVVYSKKLITTNMEVQHFSFYNKNNILLIDDINNLPTVDSIKAFVAKPFIPYTDEQLYEIGFDHWLSGFSSH